MVVANEYTFTQTMLDKGIPLDTIRELRREFKGWRIYFRGKVSEYEDIKSDYKIMLDTGYTRIQAIDALSESYDKTVQRMKIILNLEDEELLVS